MFTRYITRHLPSQTNREMQTKPRGDIHFIPLRVVITKKIKDVASVSKDIPKRKPLHNVREYKLLRVMWKTGWSSPNKLKTEPSCNLWE